MNGLAVGRWTINGDGQHELVYDPTWIESEQGRALSLSLPFNFDGKPLLGRRVQNYFDNLLPDNEAIRKRLRDRYALDSDSAFDLLTALGSDCVGALQLSTGQRAPSAVTTIDAEPIDTAQVARVLRATTSTGRMFAGDDDFRISIAGAQEKTALLWHKGQWCRPRGATPTTHIFKLPLGFVGGMRADLRTSVENEWLCSKLIEAFGVPIARARIERFEDTKALVVERFDRELHRSKQWWMRLPQEDFCQATATPSSQKYESDGGPGLATIARILATSSNRDGDLATLMRAQLLFVLLAATDGHAKNFSVHLLAKGAFRLTPLYDVLSAWPVVGDAHDQVHEKKLKLAMALWAKNRHYKHCEITRHHLVETAKSCGVHTMESIIDETLARLEGAIDEVGQQLTEGFPEALFVSIAEGMRRTAKRLGSDR
ncbi:MAG: type II toxin-antitoxin system HipA family toxin [Polyangiales bacterium]